MIDLFRPQLCVFDFYPHEAHEVNAETVLCEVRRAHLYGHLYPHPSSAGRRRALERLEADGIAERVPPTAASIGGWWAPAPGRVRAC
jgi:hypothetical protein